VELVRAAVRLAEPDEGDCDGAAIVERLGEVAALAEHGQGALRPAQGALGVPHVPEKAHAGTVVVGALELGERQEQPGLDGRPVGCDLAQP
jgi:hypothetical protein